MDVPIAVELLRRAKQISEILTSRGHAYAFIGGLAMNAWTIPVPTYDIDLCVAIAVEDVPDLREALHETGLGS